MIKKIVIFVFLLIVISVFGVVYLLNNNINGIINDKKTNNTNVIKTNRFYDKNNDELDYRLLFSYLCYNNDFYDVPVTDNYKAKFINNISKLYSFEQYNEDLYNYEVDDPNQMFSWVKLYEDNTFFIQLFIYKSAYDDQPKLNRELFFKYKVDENGFVDDIELIKEDVYREDDGTPIIRPNYRKFDKPENYANYFIEMIYGLEFAKYMKETEPYGHYEGADINDIEWQLKEYALTDNLKNSYDIKKGLIPDEIKKIAYNSFEGIGVFYQENYFSYSDDFPKGKKAIVPIELYCKGKSYYYNLSYSITDDYFLDSLSLEKS